jgi:hypothetical protein
MTARCHAAAAGDRLDGQTRRLSAENALLAFHLRQMLDCTGPLEPCAFRDDAGFAAFASGWNTARFILDQRIVWAGLGRAGEGQP